MRRVLVVYGTKSGCTRGVAERIAGTLQAEGIAAEVAQAGRDLDPSGYDAVIVGSGVRIGQWHVPVRDWVVANADALKRRPVAFFTVCLTMAADAGRSEEVRSYTDTLIEDSGVQPLDLGLFAGWFEPDKFSLLERIVLKSMKAPVGDHRDWGAVDEWTLRAASSLNVAG